MFNTRRDFLLKVGGAFTSLTVAPNLLSHVGQATPVDNVQHEAILSPIVKNGLWGLPSKYLRAENEAIP